MWCLIKLIGIVIGVPVLIALLLDNTPDEPNY